MNDDDRTVPDSNVSEYTDDSESPRPNRWNGPSSTWRTLTAQERGLATTLDQIRNADLSIHLYNAHALKQRARRYEQNPEKVKKEYPAIPDEDQIFEPPKSWTAWPLPPDVVPREGERIGPKDVNEKYTFKRREAQRPSRELEDVLLSVTVRFAKERFEGRPPEDETDSQLEIQRNITEVTGRDEDEDEEGSDSQDSDEISDGNGGVRVKEGSATPPVKEQLIPVVSADDDRSRNILQPSIRHTIAKLDEVLMALHHARKACRRYSHSSAASANSEDEAEAEREDPDSAIRRPRGRPRKFADLPDRSRAPCIAPEKVVDDADLFRGKTTHLGRPLKNYERFGGESQQDYLVRIARIQKKPLPAFAPPVEIKLQRSSTPSPEKSRRSLRIRATSEERAAQHRKRLRPRDWSEILSAAAVTGFPSEVITRATQRCANLFREGMVMRTIAETPFMEKVPDTVTRYVPAEIPDLDDEVLESSSDESDSSEHSLPDAQMKSEWPNAKAIRKAHVPPSKQTCFCPVLNCPRMIRGFLDNAALKRHIEQGHQIAKDEVDAYILQSDEEMHGGVHIDGFLKPVKRLGGVRTIRSPYKKFAKRTRVEESSEGGESGDEDDDEA